MAERVVMPGVSTTTDDRRNAREEAALVRAAQTTPAVFGQLYQRYVQRIYRYVHARVGAPEDAADLTQQVFLRALEALPTYREHGVPFGAWLFRIAHNTTSNFLRRQPPRVSWEQLPAHEHPRAVSEPEGQVLRHEEIAALRQLVATLDAEKQELLALRFAGGLTAREIAMIVGKNEAAVKKQLTRIIHTLGERHDEYATPLR